MTAQKRIEELLIERFRTDIRCAVPPPIRRSSFVRKLVLAIVVLFSALAFPSVYGPFDLTPPAARATPSLSGAIAVYPPNATFSGAGKGQVGTPPTKIRLRDRLVRG